MEDVVSLDVRDDGIGFARGRSRRKQAERWSPAGSGFG